MSTCVYDNPFTCHREAWQDGNLIASISIQLMSRKGFKGHRDLFFGLNVNGEFFPGDYRGDISAIPEKYKNNLPTRKSYMETLHIGVTQLPQYQCHKIVGAAKIKEVIPHAILKSGDWTLVPEDSDISSIQVSAEYAMKHSPQVGGYYVQYDDGYSSYSPAAAFEAGYKLIEK